MSDQENTNTDEVETISDLEGPHGRVGEETMNEVYDAIVTRVQEASDYDESAMQLFSNAPDDIPENYEISVTTYKSRESETYDGVFVWTTPTVEAINKDAPNYLAEINRAKHTSRLTDTARRFILANEEGEPNFPVTIRQFVTRASSGIAQIYTPAFESVYPLLKAAVKSLKVYNLSKRELFDCTTNAAYASFHYPHAEKDDLFIKLMRAAITRIDLEPTDEKPALEHKGVKVTSEWFKTQLTARDEAEYNVEETISTDDAFTF